MVGHATRSGTSDDKTTAKRSRVSQGGAADHTVVNIEPALSRYCGGVGIGPDGCERIAAAPLDQQGGLAGAAPDIEQAHTRRHHCPGQTSDFGRIVAVLTLA
jgi:hypothetical protein